MLENPEKLREIVKATGAHSTDLQSDVYKRQSIYLLQSGLVPCENTGKQTRCYKIAKADVAAYLRRRLAEPAYYTPPSGWYKNYPNHKPPAFSPVSYTHLQGTGDGRHAGDCPRPDRRGGCYHYGGQQPAKGTYSPKRKGVRVQNEIRCHKTLAGAKRKW